VLREPRDLREKLELQGRKARQALKGPQVPKALREWERLALQEQQGRKELLGLRVPQG